MRVPQQHAARSKCVLYRGSNSGTCTGDNVISDPEWDRYSRDQTYSWEKEAPSHIDGSFSLSTDALAWARLPTTSATVVEGSTRLHMVSQHLINSCDAQTVDFSVQSVDGMKLRCRYLVAASAPRPCAQPNALMASRDSVPVTSRRCRRCRQLSATHCVQVRNKRERDQTLARDPSDLHLPKSDSDRQCARKHARFPEMRRRHGGGAATQSIVPANGAGGDAGPLARGRE